MNRRDFLMLHVEGNPDHLRQGYGGPPKPCADAEGLHDEDTAVLSCERLYMRYLDSQMDASTPVLFANLREDLRKITTLRLTDTSWLSCGDLKEHLDAALRDTGVTVA